MRLVTWSKKIGKKRSWKQSDGLKAMTSSFLQVKDTKPGKPNKAKRALSTIELNLAGR